MKVSTLKEKVIHTVIVAMLGLITLVGIATVVPHSTVQVPAAYADGCDGGVNPPPGYDENCNPLPTATATATQDPDHTR